MSVIFDQLRISDNGNRLFIDFHVSEATDYSNYYLKSLTITTADYVPETISLSDVSDYVYKKYYPEPSPIIGGGNRGKRTDSLIVDAPAFDKAFYNGKGSSSIDINKAYATIPYNGTSLSGPLFFVWVELYVPASQSTPCFADEPVLGVTFDGKLLYQQAMGYTKELADDCTISDGFIDFILNYSAFKSAVETDHFCDAKTFYNQMFNLKNNPKRVAGRGCGCHG